MIRNATLSVLMILVLSAPAAGQFRAPSPDGLASTQTGGRYVGGREPYYVDGKWIEVSYGRPIKRGRDLWGSDGAYGMWLNRGAPVWRAGADVSTYLMTEAPLVIDNTRLEPGGYTMFIDLETPEAWTLIVSNWQPQRQYDPDNDRELWGSYGYTPAKDVVRVPMDLSTLSWSVDQLTWLFLDVTDTGGTLALMWDRVMASVPFAVASEEQATLTDDPSPSGDPRTPPEVVNAPPG
jgi:hypothetical protein